MILNFQSQPFVDFKVRQIHIRKTKTALEQSKLSRISSTFLFAKGPDVGSGAIKHAFLDESLRSLYGVDFNSVQKQFTTITDSEASIARMENNSISSRICPTDEKWVSCYVHVLQKRLKSVFYFSTTHARLQKLGLISSSSMFFFFYYLSLLGSYC